MAHAIRLTVVLTTPPIDVVAAFHRAPETWLPIPLRRNGADSWQVYLWAGELGVLVECRVGEVLSRGEVWQRALRWRPLRIPGGGLGDGLITRAVPTFAGHLALVDRHDGRAELTIAGRYRPPGGAAGSLIDRLAMHRVARRIAKTFVTSVGERIDEVAQHSVP